MKTVTREVTARQLRSELASLVNEVAFGGGRIVLHRYGRAVAFLIGVDDFQRLRRLESAPGALDAEETLDELSARLIREGREERAAADATAGTDGTADITTGGTLNVATGGTVDVAEEAGPGRSPDDGRAEDAVGTNEAIWPLSWFGP